MDLAILFERVVALLPFIAVFSLMFSMGMRLVVRDFLYVLREPKAAILGLTGQIILLPIVAALIAIVFRLDPNIAVGLMIIAACPGGATSNAFSVLVKGDIALSISLTAMSSLLAFLTMPLIINMSLVFFNYGDGDVTLSFAETATQLFFTTALPVILGMVFRAFLPKITSRVTKPLFYFGFACLFYPMFAFFAKYIDLVDRSDIFQSTSAILLNVTMMCIGAGLGAVSGLSRRQSKTLSVEVGIQNFVLVLVVIGVFLKDLTLLVPSMIYLPSMYVAAFTLSFLSKRYMDEDISASEDSEIE
jgi:BASS family bile acid:Na+ symporter